MAPKRKRPQQSIELGPSNHPASCNDAALQLPSKELSGRFFSAYLARCDEAAKAKKELQTARKDADAKDDELHVLKEELRTLEEKFQDDVEHWKSESCTAQDDLSRSRRAYGIVCARLNRLSDDPDPEKTLAAIVCEYDALLKQREVKRESLRQRIDTPQSTKPDLQMLMEDITTELQYAVESFEFTAWNESLQKDHPLGWLAGAVFGCDVVKAMESLERCLKLESSRLSCLYALCGAALAKWVFKQSHTDALYDRHQGVASRTSSSRYRMLIELLNSLYPVLASRLDSIVHTEAARDDGLEHFKRTKARHLAQRLQEALMPLREPVSGEQSDGDSEADGMPFDDRFVRIFHKALDLQCQLGEGGLKYEWSWPNPGAVFHNATMTTERFGIDPEIGHPKTTGPHTVISMTLLPGLCVYPDNWVGPRENGDCWIRALVSKEQP